MDLIEKYSLNQLYEKAMKDEFGNGKEREEKLGEIYPLIQNIINIRYGHKKRRDVSKLFKKIAIKILKGELNEEKIKQNLGEKYYSNVLIEKEKGVEKLELELKTPDNTLEEKIIELAKGCIEGIYGDSSERKKKIGEIFEKEIAKDLPKNKEERQKIIDEFYEKVREKVNELLEDDCDEVKKYYERINSYVEKVCNLYEAKKYKEIEQFKEEHIHDYPLVLYAVKTIIPSYNLESEDVYELIAMEVLNGTYKDGETRKRYLDSFDKDLYKRVQEYVENFKEEEIRKKLEEED